MLGTFPAQSTSVPFAGKALRSKGNRLKRIAITIVSLALALGLFGCATFSAAPKTDMSAFLDPDLIRIGDWMSGSFTSALQAEQNSNFHGIELEVQLIWTDSFDARWLYAEQAMIGHKGKPYHQRVYRISRRDYNIFEIATFMIPDELIFVGAWADPDRFDSLSADDLILLEGCTLFLEAMGNDGYAGITEGVGCASSRNGASYSIRHITIRTDRFMSWERGYDARGIQVWGSRDCGYIFDKRP